MRITSAFRSTVVLAASATLLSSCKFFDDSTGFGADLLGQQNPHQTVFSGDTGTIVNISSGSLISIQDKKGQPGTEDSALSFILRTSPLIAGTWQGERHFGFARFINADHIDEAIAAKLNGGASLVKAEVLFNSSLSENTLTRGSHLEIGRCSDRFDSLRIDTTSFRPLMSYPAEGRTEFALDITRHFASAESGIRRDTIAEISVLHSGSARINDTSTFSPDTIRTFQSSVVKSVVFAIPARMTDSSWVDTIPGDTTAIYRDTIEYNDTTDYLVKTVSIRDSVRHIRYRELRTISDTLDTLIGSTSKNYWNLTVSTGVIPFDSAAHDSSWRITYGHETIIATDRSWHTARDTALAQGIDTAFSALIDSLAPSSNQAWFPLSHTQQEPDTVTISSDTEIRSTDTARAYKPVIADPHLSYANDSMSRTVRATGFDTITIARTLRSFARTQFSIANDLQSDPKNSADGKVFCLYAQARTDSGVVLLTVPVLRLEFRTITTVAGLADTTFSDTLIHPAAFATSIVDRNEADNATSAVSTAGGHIARYTLDLSALKATLGSELYNPLWAEADLYLESAITPFGVDDSLLRVCYALSTRSSLGFDDLWRLRSSSDARYIKVNPSRADDTVQVELSGQLSALIRTQMQNHPTGDPIPDQVYLYLWQPDAPAGYAYQALSRLRWKNAPIRLTYVFTDSRS